MARHITQKHKLKLVKPNPNAPDAVGEHQQPKSSKWVNTPHRTQLGLAMHFATQHGSRVRYCAPWKRWLIWDGHRWQVDQTGKVMVLLKGTVKTLLKRAIEIPDQTAREAELKWLMSCEKRAYLRDALGLAESETHIPITPDALDSDPWLLTTKTGTLDLRTGELREHSRADLATKWTPIEFDPNAKCPRWERFISEIMGGDLEMVQFLQRAVGYSLSGDVSEQALLFLHGSGSNGKSVFLQVLHALGGDYSLQASSELLLAKKGADHPTATAGLFGKRVVIVSETEQGRAFSESVLKSLTGGDRITARRMYQDFWEFDPTHQLWLATNHRPTIRGTDHAVWRRMLLVPFGVCFSGKQKDPQLLAKLKSELPGILAWAVRGCLQWQKVGLSAPKVITDAVQEYRTEMDTIGLFLRECLEVNQHTTISAGEIYRVYAAWCRANGERPVNNRVLGLALSERGYEKIKRSVYVYLGYTLTMNGRDFLAAADAAAGASSRVNSEDVDL